MYLRSVLIYFFFVTITYLIFLSFGKYIAIAISASLGGLPAFIYEYKQRMKALPTEVKIRLHEDFIGKKFILKKYFRWNEKWDHDHCEICGAKFMLSDPACLQEGYVTENNSNWICKECFEKYSAHLGWEV